MAKEGIPRPIEGLLVKTRELIDQSRPISTAAEYMTDFGGDAEPSCESIRSFWQDVRTRYGELIEDIRSRHEVVEEPGDSE